MRTKQADTVLSIGYKNYKELYIDWVNNFLTTVAFADYHHIDHKVAISLIDDASYLYKDIKL